VVIFQPFDIFNADLFNKPLPVFDNITGFVLVAIPGALFVDVQGVKS
jgi:hypothetical protein